MQSALIHINSEFQQSYFSIQAVVIAYKILIGKNNLSKDNNHAIFLAVNKYSTRIGYRFIDLDINKFSNWKGKFNMLIYLLLCNVFHWQAQNNIHNKTEKQNKTKNTMVKKHSQTSRKLEMLKLRLPRKIASVPSCMYVYDKVYNCM